MSDDWYRVGMRATDDEMKKEIIDRLFEVWKANPSLRFMQLLGNIFRGDAYYVEDYDMIKVVEKVYDRS
jgi:hypothetical protein